MSIIFKLKYRDITRRTILAKLPEWNVLAERLSSIFLVPVADVGVSYLDRDGDEITLNSQEELDDFYTTTYRDGESIRFTVKDLSASHSISRDSHEFTFRHPPSFPPPFPPGFPPAHYTEPELTLSYGMPPPPPFSPLHHHQVAQPPTHLHPQSGERMGHGPHGHHEHHRHRQHPHNRPCRWHHQPPPLISSLSVTLWGPHGSAHRSLPDHLSDHSHSGPSLSALSHEIPNAAPESPHVPDFPV